MIESFGNKIAEDVWTTGRSSKIPTEIHVRAKVILTIMHATSTIDDLKIKGQPPALRIHKLTGNRTGWVALDIAGKTCPWRLVFKFRDGRFLDVKIEDYH